MGAGDSPALFFCTNEDSVTPPRKILLSWSSGKDSAWTLHVLRQRGEVEVVDNTAGTHNLYYPTWDYDFSVGYLNNGP